MPKKLLRRNKTARKTPVVPAPKPRASTPKRTATRTAGPDGTTLAALLDPTPSATPLAALLDPTPSVLKATPAGSYSIKYANKTYHTPLALNHFPSDREAILLNLSDRQAEMLRLDETTGLVQFQLIKRINLKNWLISSIGHRFGTDPITRKTIKLPNPSVNDIAKKFASKAKECGVTREAADRLNDILNLTGSNRIKVNTVKIEKALDVMARTPEQPTLSGRSKRTEAQKAERRKRRQQKLAGMTPAQLKAFRDAKNAKRRLRRLNRKKAAAAK